MFSSRSSGGYIIAVDKSYDVKFKRQREEDLNYSRPRQHLRSTVLDNAEQSKLNWNTFPFWQHVTTQSQALDETKDMNSSFFQKKTFPIIIFLMHAMTGTF